MPAGDTTCGGQPLPLQGMSAEKVRRHRATEQAFSYAEPERDRKESCTGYLANYIEEPCRYGKAGVSLQRTKHTIMETKHQNIPAGWAVCFLTGCRRKQECLRYQAGLNLPDDVETREAVVPSVLKKERCPRFLKTETEHVAYGFTRIFYDVKSRHIADMRSAIRAYLGGRGTYYRYLHGEQALMPEQQQWIRRLFADYGYPGKVEFDRYEDQPRLYATDS